MLHDARVDIARGGKQAGAGRRRLRWVRGSRAKAVEARGSRREHVRRRGHLFSWVPIRAPTRGPLAPTRGSLSGLLLAGYWLCIHGLLRALCPLSPWRRSLERTLGRRLRGFHVERQLTRGIRRDVGGAGRTRLVRVREKPAGEPADALRLGKRLDLSRGRRRHTDATGDESWGGQGTGERSGAGEGGTTMTLRSRVGCELGADMPTAYVMAQRRSALAGGGGSEGGIGSLR